MCFFIVGLDFGGLCLILFSVCSGLGLVVCDIRVFVFCGGFGNLVASSGRLGLV